MRLFFLSQLSEQFIVSLLPPLKIENLLPCELEFKVIDTATTRLQQQGKIESGADFPLHEVDFSIDYTAAVRICIPGYEWSTSITVEPTQETQNFRLVDHYDKKGTITICAQMM